MPFGKEFALELVVMDACGVRSAHPTACGLAGAAIAGFAPNSPEAADDDLPTILRLVAALTSGNGSVPAAGDAAAPEAPAEEAAPEAPEADTPDETSSDSGEEASP